MPPLIIPLAAQVVCSGTLGGGTETWANVTHIAIGGGTFDQNEADAVKSVYEDYYTAVRGRRNPAGWSLTRISIRDIRSEGTETFDYPLVSVVGNGTGTWLPYNVACVVTLRSQTNSRRGRGRMYLSGLTSQALGTSTGRFSNAFCDSEAADVSQLGQDLLAEGFPLAIASRVSGQLFSVSEVSVDNRPDTMRSRVKDLPVTYTSVAGVTGPP